MEETASSITKSPPILVLWQLCPCLSFSLPGWLLRIFLTTALLLEEYFNGISNEEKVNILKIGFSYYYGDIYANMSNSKENEKERKKME